MHIAVLDSRGCIIETNRAWKKFGDENGLVSDAHNIGENYLEVCDKAKGDFSREAKPVAQGIRAVLKGESTVYTLVEYPCDGPEQKRWFKLTVIPLMLTNERGALVVHQNVTKEHILYNEELREQRIQSIGTLASGVAHNINNLLTPVVLGVDLIDTHGLGKDEVNVLEAIKENAIRGANLSRQLLDFARGSDSSEKVLVNPVKPIRAIEKLIRTSFPENINVHVGTQPGVQSLIGNEDQLHQAILNLCINSRDAMEGGGDLSLVLEKVDLTREDKVLPLDCVPGSFIKIQIRDTGEGIDVKHLDNIFDPFFTTKPIGKGVGLGLSSTLGIVQSHGGFIDVKTELNKGTEFNIYLPEAEAEAEANQERFISEDQSKLLSEASLDVKKEAAKVKKNFYVLVVEDEEPVREMILRSLKKIGIQTLTATNGVEALSLFLENESQIGMTITNLRMPVMNGRDLVKLLKKADPSHIVIVSSGTAEKDMLDLQKSGLIAGYLPKPFDLRSIERVILTALKLPEESVKALSV